ncbi:DUF983 domain-containing protein [Afifella marina]|uniref:Uncharacterized conserved protein, DUF983 family n=1 Tax=Afifella marina DSM 2698 TaxID=1120955 RepID=A0A1G5NJK3_AFIMA|nr:DUF983 domain-containing protein [Afifella marina]MBK1623612.1 hypothetical protein [Afifella marina DSM 2698]MBK1626605.1 hypothetical protein [Afifella marina]MBK5916154.1 hypothetical protein [Afifella marina]RAI21645.1 hypothetical protein CH311_06420 [Afifella marina DSM 2698]SCZ37354.1 Uncharacterized conserved protein, DUF983 family [Afifella marina DSM 2698]
MKRPRPVIGSILRGLAGRCPQCGKGSLFRGFLTVPDTCAVCGEELYHHRADDAPPYFIILIVGHVIVALALAVELMFQPPIWVHMALWVPLATLLSLALLRPVKGGVIGLQWALRMHGFDPENADAADKNVDTAWQ